MLDEARGVDHEDARRAAGAVGDARGVPGVVTACRRILADADREPQLPAAESASRQALVDRRVEDEDGHGLEALAEKLDRGEIIEEGIDLRPGARAAVVLRAWKSQAGRGYLLSLNLKMLKRMSSVGE